LDIGLAASIRHAQLQAAASDGGGGGGGGAGGSTGSPSWEEIVQDRHWSAAAKDGLTPELKISLLPVGISGDPLNPIQYRAKPFVAVSFNNVTTDDGQGAVFGPACSPACRASPVEPWLSCGVMPIKPAVSDLLRKTNKKPKDCQMIAEYITQDQVNARVTLATITASDPNASFHILVDGHLAGPFNRVKVSAVQNPGRSSATNAMKFPIQTFFPAHLANPAS
jgi:hypothetical protein